MWIAPEPKDNTTPLEEEDKFLEGHANHADELLNVFFSVPPQCL